MDKGQSMGRRGAMARRSQGTSQCELVHEGKGKRRSREEGEDHEENGT